MALQTEYTFTLPQGYVDDEGSLHNKGVMRLATAGDEILPLRDPRVQNNPSYLSVILLSRVITKLGTLTDINPGTIEGFFIEDLAFLQELYSRINGGGSITLKTTCSHCGEEVGLSFSPPK